MTPALEFFTRPPMITGNKKLKATILNCLYVILNHSEQIGQNFEPKMGSSRQNEKFDKIKFPRIFDLSNNLVTVQGYSFIVKN